MDFQLPGLGPEKTTLIISGAAGGLVRWLTLRDHWTDGVISIAVGAICSVFVSPIALPALGPVLSGIGMQNDSVSALSGFLIGIGGITVSGFLIDAWRLRQSMLGKQPPEIKK